jgi:hypothetical protein
MPASIYVYALLAAMAIAAGVAFISEARDHAADSATYKANLQTAQDNLKAAHDANDELAREKARAERSLAAARTAAAQANARYEASANRVSRIELRVPSVRAYLDDAMPCELYRELRHDLPGTDQGDCEESAAPSGDPRTGAGAGAAGAAQP